MKKTIYPCLWFNGNANEAADLYCSVFKDSKITFRSPMVVNFELSGQKFMCLNGGPGFKFNPSISFYVVYESLTGIDEAWAILLEGGSVMMPLDKYAWSEKYGWLQDRFGLNWQLSYGSIELFGQKFTPVLMYTGDQNGRAEEAINFYTSVFENSSIKFIMRYPEGLNEFKDAIQHAQFSIGENRFMAMDSSLEHNFNFNEAISFTVECVTQEEIDYFWNIFTEEGKEVQCGWLKDKFGVSWQIVPSILGELMSEPSRAERVTKAFLQMKKFDIEKLKNA
jgi:predicted 3-demethylubiquinone-9 3-methyltransferase (glyoxalase superfamily)